MIVLQENLKHQRLLDILFYFLINNCNVLGVTADMLLCDEIRTGYKIKSSMITEKIEKLSPSDRDKIMQILDIMLGEK